MKAAVAFSNGCPLLPPVPPRVPTGPRYVVQIGEKVIDYNEDFRLFLATRNPSPFIPPDAASIVTEVNFTTTRAGLRGQVRRQPITCPRPGTSALWDRHGLPEMPHTEHRGFFLSQKTKALSFLISLT